MPRQRVAVTGSSGLIGSALSASLRERGDDIVRLVRHDPSAPDQRRWDASAPDGTDPEVLADVDVVVNLAGAGLGDHRWTDSYKDTLVRSRVDTTSRLAEAMARLRAEGRGPRRLVSGSAVGFYGSRGDEVLTEESVAGRGFLADLVQAWEAATAPAARAGVSVALARTGIVLSPKGGALGQLLPLARWGLAGPLGRGRHYWPWITLRDEVDALVYLVDHPQVTGPVNLTAPTPLPQREIAAQLGRVLRRPAVLPAPTPALRIALGEFAGDLVASQRAVPSVLLESGYVYSDPDLPEALRALLWEQ